jgi:hypothetical protein
MGDANDRTAAVPTAAAGWRSSRERDRAADCLGDPCGLEPGDEVRTRAGVARTLLPVTVIFNTAVSLSSIVVTSRGEIQRTLKRHWDGRCSLCVTVIGAIVLTRGGPWQQVG